ncbi:hypothetical protein DB346_16595 [Verrucomicrobia bacterium LW23]|nr:hypothetical protein DB346_16595 [Verrucomicrobia bacterium LW23]
MQRLFHVSDNGGIARFEPRPPPASGAAALGVAEPCVWAVDAMHLPHYLLPRDCPRVAFYPLPTSTQADVRAFFGPASALDTADVRQHVVAIESAWLERALGDEIWIYELPSDTFSVIDAGAGYHTSRVAVDPLGVRRVASPFRELAAGGVEIRVVPSLWPLRDAVVLSTLQFSCIRMRNALPRRV